MTTALPIYRCLNFDEFEKSKIEWFFSDVTFFQCVLLATSAYQDAAVRGAFSDNTIVRMRRTLGLLNEKLSDSRTALMESTIFVIVILTAITATGGDFEAVRAHLNGLRQMLLLPGATNFSPAMNKLRLKIDQ
jgi:hypothetical protein